MTQSSRAVSSADAQAIEQIITDIERGFNTNNPELMIRHMAEDALIVNPLGEVMYGPRSVEQSARALLVDGPLGETTAHYRLTDLTQLVPGVIVAHKNAWSTRESADAGDPPGMNSLYVLVNREGKWWIVRRQNTAIGG